MSAAITACLLTGCQAPAPTPAPVPTYTCTPEAGGAEFECTQHQYDQMLAKDKLYAEAEAVYRKFLEEDIRILRAGGISEPTPALLKTTTGDFLEDSMALYRSFKQEQTRMVGGDVKLLMLERKPGVAKQSSVVALVVCVDARSANTETKGEVVGRGPLVEDLLYFGRFDGDLRIQGADGKEVAECSGS